MSRSDDSARRWLAAAVLAHVVVAAVHGATHAEAHVLLSPAAKLYVLVVILAGPLAGLVLTWRAGRVGAWLVAATMSGALVFGVLNHFVVAGPDNVSSVDQRSRVLFAATALLLVVTEALGAGLAVHLVRERRPS